VGLRWSFFQSVNQGLFSRLGKIIARQIIYLEIEVLGAYAKKEGIKLPIQLGEAVHLLARIGGYLSRTSDPPGCQVKSNFEHGIRTDGFAKNLKLAFLDSLTR